MLESLLCRKSYDDLAAASYPIDFRFFGDDIFVTLTNADGTTDELTEGLDYSVSAPGSAGTLTPLRSWTTFYPNAIKATIHRETVAKQTIDFANGDKQDAEVYEGAIDRCFAFLQELRDKYGRQLTLPTVDEIDLKDLPTQAGRAGLFLAFDSDGQPLASPGPSGVATSAWAATFLDDLTLLEAQKTLGLIPAGNSKAIGPLSADVQSLLDDQTLSDMQATLKIAAAPPSSNISAIIVSGSYIWGSRPETTNMPSLCAAWHFFILDVKANSASSLILQRLFDLTIGPSAVGFEWIRQSTNSGASWSPWIVGNAPAVGETYTQLPGHSDPSTLWPGTTWSNISSESLLKGRVLRIEGAATNGSAASFGATQDDQMQGHESDLPVLVAGSGTGQKGLRMSSGSTLYMNADDVTSSPGGQASAPTGPDGSNGPPRLGTETRVASVTVREWQRIA